MKKCIMLQTPDKKKLFTLPENLKHLVKFSKLFNISISVVEVEDTTSLSNLEELATAFCERKNQSSKFKHLKTKINASKKVNCNKIRDYIKSKLLNGHTVSLKSLCQRYKNFTTASLCIYFKQVREELKAKGYNVNKVGGGKYKIVSL